MELDTARFREVLEAERTRLSDEIAGLQDENSENVDTDGQSFGASNHPADAASDVMARERNMGVGMDLQAELDDITNALARLDEGQYGRCETCGQPIPIERLEARPAATLCIDHQREREHGA